MSDDSIDDFPNTPATGGSESDDDDDGVPATTESVDETSGSAEEPTKIPSEDDQKSFYEVV